LFIEKKGFLNEQIKFLLIFIGRQRNSYVRESIRDLTIICRGADLAQSDRILAIRKEVMNKDSRKNVSVILARSITVSHRDKDLVL